jgi:hypothetical protein
MVGGLNEGSVLPAGRSCGLTRNGEKERGKGERREGEGGLKNNAVSTQA